MSKTDVLCELQAENAYLRAVADAAVVDMCGMIDDFPKYGTKAFCNYCLDKQQKCDTCEFRWRGLQKMK